MPSLDQLTQRIPAAHFPAGFDVVEFRHLMAAPLLLLIIIIAHWVYFRLHRQSDGQQVIELCDLSDLDPSKCSALDEQLTLIEASCVEFDARDRTEVPVRLSAPRDEPAAGGQVFRYASAQLIENRVVSTPLICAEDLVVDGATEFLGALKVGGDLVVRGNATFFRPVVVNGVLKVEGEAIFAVGVLAKGEAFVSGLITIGSERGKGWAALHELALRTRLRLNGRVVATRAVQICEAA
jgi:hypothetical protein